MTTQIPLLSLKHGSSYIIDNPDGTMTFIKFKALIKTESFFKMPLAQFTWEDDPTHVSETYQKSFTGELIFSEKLPFELVYRGSAWWARLRYKPGT